MATIDWTAVREEALGGVTAVELPPTLELPALPQAVTRFLERSKNPNATLRELAAILETDTGLTVELLRFVNSAFVGLRHKATSVQQALSLLGMRQSRTFVVTTGMQAAVRARRSKLINQACFWNASLQKALFAREVAKLLRADTEEAFAAALLQDYLLPVITNDLLDDYLEFIRTRDEQPACLCEFEAARFGWDHAFAGACLAHRWQLPDALVCGILFHHKGLGILADPKLGRSSVAAVALSALLPDQLRQHYAGLEQLALLQEKWPAFNLEEIVREVDAQHEQIGVGVRNDFPLWRRCRPVLTGEDAGTTDPCMDGTLQASALR